MAINYAVTAQTEFPPELWQAIDNAAELRPLGVGPPPQRRSFAPLGF
jgi:hypothetical protein